MNVFDIVFTSLKSPVALLIVFIYDGNIIYYFSYQLFIVLIEQLCIAVKFYSLLPSLSSEHKLFSMQELKRIMPFAIGIAYTSGIWVFTTQLDKLMLSKLLTLSEFGYFSLVATVASGLAVLSGPISKAVLPRMTALLSQGKEMEMLNLYKLATRLVVCIITPITLILSFYAKNVIVVWTGDSTAAEWIAPIMPLYIIGNGLLAILAFQYYLQYAYGKLSYHIKYNTFYAILVIPIMIYAVLNYGAKGAGYVWLCSQLVTIMLWVPFVHHIFSPGLHLKWLVHDVILPIISALFFVLTFLLACSGYFPNSRIMGILFFALLALTSIGFSLSLNFSSYIRKFIHERL